MKEEQINLIIVGKRDPPTRFCHLLDTDEWQLLVWRAHLINCVVSRSPKKKRKRTLSHISHQNLIKGNGTERTKSSDWVQILFTNHWILVVAIVILSSTRGTVFSSHHLSSNLWAGFIPSWDNLVLPNWRPLNSCCCDSNPAKYERNPRFRRPAIPEGTTSSGGSLNDS